MRTAAVANNIEIPMPQQFRILGIPISAVNMSGACALIVSWTHGLEFRSVFVREAASLMAAVSEPRLAHLHEEADLVVADGTPLVWLGWAKGFSNELGRVAGADLVDAVCRESVAKKQSHFFYGGQPGVAAEMASRLAVRYPGLHVAGTLSPPMRDIGPSFEPDDIAMAEIEHIKSKRPDFIWVGLSSPKQEYWIMQAGPLIGRGVFLGVGAAFDFHAGTVRRAPEWLRDNGLEWAHRLYSEPRRLWRRYLILAPKFAIAAVAEEVVRRTSRRRRGENRRG